MTPWPPWPRAGRSPAGCRATSFPLHLPTDDPEPMTRIFDEDLAGGLATRAILGQAPQFPQGLSPQDAVAQMLASLDS